MVINGWGELKPIFLYDMWSFRNVAAYSTRKTEICDGISRRVIIVTKIQYLDR